MINQIKQHFFNGDSEAADGVAAPQQVRASGKGKSAQTVRGTERGRGAGGALLHNEWSLVLFVEWLARW